MIRLTMNAQGEPVIDHGTHGPLVYLDHAALMEVAQGFAPEFADPLTRREGDLVLSWLNFAELAVVSDETATAVESLIGRVLPRIAFLEVLVDKVIEAEDRLIAGTSRSAPHLDTSLLSAFLADADSLNPLDPTSFFARVRSPEAIESARRGWVASRELGSAVWHRHCHGQRDLDQRAC